MPPRPRRRAGSRAGNLSRELEKALLDEAARLAATGDAKERVTAVNDFYAQLDWELEAIADVRLAAVKELRLQGLSYDAIAKETGLSKSRVAQLAHASRTAGRKARVRKTS